MILYYVLYPLNIQYRDVTASKSRGKASNVDRPEIWTTTITDTVLKPPRVYHHFFPLRYAPPVIE